MKKQFLILPFALLVLLVTGCCKGGTGGKASLACAVFHHSHPISGCRIYIKYNATEFPGRNTSSYDNYVDASVNSNTVTFTNLNCGNYYLYAAGFDSTIMLPVSGGVQFKIKFSERTKQESTTIPVTE